MPAAEKGGTMERITPHTAPPAMAEEAAVQAQRLRVVAYCRVSTDRPAQERSIEMQKQHYETFIAANPDWALAGIYWEVGVTGTKAEVRPELQRLLADGRAGLIDLVLTKSISRFSRSTTDCLQLVRTLTELGIGIVFQKENIDTRSMGSEFLLTLLSSIAEEESRSISTNLQWAARKRFENGTYKYSIAPYGYRLVEGSFAVDPREAEIVREIFIRTIGGEGSPTLARDLNARGIPTGTKRRDGSPGVWSPSMILGILKNVTYTGDVLMQKTFHDQDLRRRRNNGERDRFYMDHHHEAIVDRATFEQANAAVKRRGAAKGNISVEGVNPRQNRYAMTGRLFCGLCGQPMKRITARGVHYWGCRAHTLNLSSCPMRREREAAIQGALMALFDRLARDPGLLANHIRRLSEADAAEGAAEAGALWEARAQLIPLMAAGCGESAALKLNALRARADALQPRPPSPALQMMDELAQAARSRAEHTPDALFEATVDHAVVTTGQVVEFHMKCGMVMTELLGMEN